MKDQTRKDDEWWKLRAQTSKLNKPIPIADINPDDYDVIFMVSDWGAAYDLMQSDMLADIVTRANAQGKILGSVCHDVLGLCGAKGVDRA